MGALGSATNPRPSEVGEEVETVLKITGHNKNNSWDSNQALREWAQDVCWQRWHLLGTGTSSTEWSTAWEAGELVTSPCILGVPSIGMVDGTDSAGAKGCLPLETRLALARVQAASGVIPFSFWLPKGSFGIAKREGRAY